uniref:Putative secreted peptide n=1 Tax=Anopheles braziliensis TaxID=58242 RepID=A0A2M3ZNV6_9DIPT
MPPHCWTTQQHSHLILLLVILLRNSTIFSETKHSLLVNISPLSASAHENLWSSVTKNVLFLHLLASPASRYCDQ